MKLYKEAQRNAAKGHVKVTHLDKRRREATQAITKLRDIDWLDHRTLL